MAAATNGPTELTLEQKRTFYRDGFIILKNIVPEEMIHAARRHVNITAGEIITGTQEAPKGKRISQPRFCETVITDLINKSPSAKY